MYTLKHKTRQHQKTSPAEKSRSYLKFGIALFAIVPGILFLISQLERTSIAWNFIQHELLVLSLFLCLLVVCDYIATLATRKNNGAIFKSHFLIAHAKVVMISVRTGVVMLMGSYYLAMYALILYRIKIGTDFNMQILTDNYREAFPTLVAILGPWLVGGIIAGTLIAWMMFAATSALILKEVSHKCRNIDFSWRLVSALLIIVIGMQLNGKSVSASEEIFEAQSADIVTPYFQKTEGLKTTSDDSIFYLQLESGNATILTQPMEINGIQYTGNYNPIIREISKDGVYFPIFWGNNFMTDKAVENILCGIAGNVQAPFSQRPSEIQTPCLPGILRASGYRTLFFQSYPDPDFANQGNFMKEIGFDEVHSSDIMPKDAIEYEWGYDDKAFYKAVFQYLKEQKRDGEKLFAYIQVSSHHMPFDSKEAYAFTRPFKEAKNFVEKYLNSYAAQDYAVQDFYNEYNAYRDKKTHLFIGPDHSYQVWNHPGTTSDKAESFPENFRIHLTYIPSEERKNEFRVGETLNGNFSQNDLIPTIFSILNKENYQRSFAEIMQKNTNPENATGNCQILTQSHAGPDIAVVKDDNYYKYSMSERTLVLYNLKNDPEALSPIVLSNNMPYKTFREHYYCEEYKDA